MVFSNTNNTLFVLTRKTEILHPPRWRSFSIYFHIIPELLFQIFFFVIISAVFVFNRTPMRANHLSRSTGLLTAFSGLYIIFILPKPWCARQTIIILNRL